MLYSNTASRTSTLISTSAHKRYVPWIQYKNRVQSTSRRKKRAAEVKFLLVNIHRLQNRQGATNNGLQCSIITSRPHMLWKGNQLQTVVATSLSALCRNLIHRAVFATPEPAVKMRLQFNFHSTQFRMALKIGPLAGGWKWNAKPESGFSKWRNHN